jgi:glutathione-independent formaldehyde dehydrogenase
MLLGAAAVIVTDFNKQRLAHAASFGCETIDLSQGGSLGERINQILKEPEVDCAVDCVGFEARQHGGEEQPATVLNQLMAVTRAAGRIGIPGLYVTEDPGAKEAAAKEGNLSLRFGLGWAKSHAFFTGQTPVLKYNRGLMMAILNDRIQIAKAVNTTVISLDDAPKGYADFDKGVARKFVIDPHGSLRTGR